MLVFHLAIEFGVGGVELLLDANQMADLLLEAEAFLLEDFLFCFGFQISHGLLSAARSME
jgi:hypothetical protein